jgi:hypothetical protein
MSTISSGSIMGALLATAKEVESSPQLVEAGEESSADYVIEPSESRDQAIARMIAEAVDAQEEADGINPAKDDPTRLARMAIYSQYDHPDRPTLVVQNSRFLMWNGKYSDVTCDVRYSVTAVVQTEFNRLNQLELAAHALTLRELGEAARSQAAEAKASLKPRATPDGKRTSVKPPKPPNARSVTTRKIGDVCAALGSRVNVPTAVEMPAFIDENDQVVDGPFPASEAIPLSNCIIRPSPDGTISRIEPTPCFFSTTCLPYDYDPQASEPTTWLGFLETILQGDHQAQALLQEWFGYCLTHDTSQQKILTIIGPPRCGKGTIQRMLVGLLGPGGAVGTTLATLGEKFGLQEMIGKNVASVGDARLSGRSDQSVIVSRLLSISGEDPIDVERKNRSPWHGTMTTQGQRVLKTL